MNDKPSATIRFDNGELIVKPGHVDLLRPYLIAPQLLPGESSDILETRRGIVEFYRQERNTLIAPMGMYRRLREVLNEAGLVVSRGKLLLGKHALAGQRPVMQLGRFFAKFLDSIATEERAAVIVRNEDDVVRRIAVLRWAYPEASIALVLRGAKNTKSLTCKLDEVGIQTVRGGTNLVISPSPLATLYPMPKYDLIVYPDATLAASYTEFRELLLQSEPSRMIGFVTIENFWRQSTLGQFMIEAIFGTFIHPTLHGFPLTLAIHPDIHRRRPVRRSDNPKVRKLEEIWLNHRRNARIAKDARKYADAEFPNIGLPTIFVKQSVVVLVETEIHKNEIIRALDQLNRDAISRPADAGEITVIDVGKLRQKDLNQQSILLLADGGELSISSFVAKSLLGNFRHEGEYPFLIVDYQYDGQPNRFEPYRICGVPILGKERFDPIYASERNAPIRKWTDLA